MTNETVVQAAPLQQEPSIDPAAAPKVLLLGEIGSGKTRSIRTLVEAGIEVFFIATEPGFETLLGDIPPDKLHWTYVQAYASSMSSLMATAKLVQQYDTEQIKKMPGVNRQKYNQWFDLLNACNNFVDARTGTAYGDVFELKPHQALVIDSLSGINNMAVNLLAGDKPCMSWPEYDACQFNIRQFVNTLTQGLKCWFVLTAHIERETDPATGLTRLMASTVGKALAPQLPKFFSEVILCKKRLVGDKLEWVWDNIDPDARLKFRNLPPAPNHRPDFKTIKDNWEKKTQY